MSKILPHYVEFYHSRKANLSEFFQYEDFKKKKKKTCKFLESIGTLTFLKGNVSREQPMMLAKMTTLPRCFSKICQRGFREVNSETRERFKGNRIDL